MKKHLIAAVSGIVLVVAGVAHAGKRVEVPAYQSMDKAAAAQVLLKHALVQAGKGSWERIAVGRMYYLGGMKAEGEAIFDALLSAEEPDASDLFRVARVYREAGEWPRAKLLFDQALAMEPKQEKWLAEVGAYYLLNGDREGAEALFDRSFQLESELWATVAAAGAYLGVPPQG